jgi:hypothetical protein
MSDANLTRKALNILQQPRGLRLFAGKPNRDVFVDRFTNYVLQADAKGLAATGHLRHPGYSDRQGAAS